VKQGFDFSEYAGLVFETVKQGSGESWREHSVEEAGEEAVRHLFEVSAGLDSQVVGEYQVLGQVKAAYQASVAARMSRFVFHRLFHTAFRVGKAVRSETGIGSGALSVGLAAVEFARRNVRLSSAKALVIGAGENAAVVCKGLVESGVKGVIIANRSVEAAEEMASRFGIERVMRLEKVGDALQDVDVVISTTGSEEPVLRAEDMAEVMSEKEGGLLIVDIAVPRDVEAAVGELEGVELVNIDALNAHVQARAGEGEEAMGRARELVEDFVRKYAKWYESLSVVPVVSALDRMGSEVARREAERYAKDFGAGEDEKLRVFAESLAKKLLHGPIQVLKGEGQEDVSEEQLRAADLIRRMWLSRENEE
jgi:glutamyl-tRNA reductase